MFMAGLYWQSLAVVTWIRGSYENHAYDNQQLQAESTAVPDGGGGGEAGDGGAAGAAWGADAGGAMSGGRPGAAEGVTRSKPATRAAVRGPPEGTPCGARAAYVPAPGRDLPCEEHRWRVVISCLLNHGNYSDGLRSGAAGVGCKTAASDVWCCCSLEKGCDVPLNDATAGAGSVAGPSSTPSVRDVMASVTLGPASSTKSTDVNPAQGNGHLDLHAHLRATISLSRACTATCTRPSGTHRRVPPTALLELANRNTAAIGLGQQWCRITSFDCRRKHRPGHAVRRELP